MWSSCDDCGAWDWKHVQRVPDDVLEAAAKLRELHDAEVEVQAFICARCGALGLSASSNMTFS